MPVFDEDAIRKLADLAKIGLADGEAAGLAAALSGAAANWDLVKAADAAGLDPWTQRAWPAPWREDAVGQSLSPEEATALSGRAAGGLFLVPEIL